MFLTLIIRKILVRSVKTPYLCVVIFFIVLDLRLTKIGSKALLPFAFLRGMCIKYIPAEF